MTNPAHRHFDLGTLRAFLVELGPEGRKNLAVLLAWFLTMLTAAMGCGIVIGLWIASP